ncbi:MAG: hypothetical protein CMQ24_11895 [Gammaproteobacteria bacterium]|nr:hypothetical protein [Gammaproteobacteria bacterium]
MPLDLAHEHGDVGTAGLLWNQLQATCLDGASPWPLPARAAAMIKALPRPLRRYTDGHTSFDANWSGS